MHYALLVYADPHAQDGHTDEQRAAVTAEYSAINDDPRVVGSGGLEPTATATTVRTTEGRTMITDGPFADTKEFFQGYFLVEAADIDAAIEIAQRMPVQRLGGSVEIRPMRFVSA